MDRGALPYYGTQMLDALVVGVLLVALAWAFRRAVRGRAPLRPVRLWVIVAVTAAIQLGFHAAATAAPSVPIVVALVFSGWSAFLLWWVWLTRAPTRRLDDGSDGDARGGGPGGGGSDDDRGGPRGGGDGEFDWEAFERDFWPYVERTRGSLPR